VPVSVIGDHRLFYQTHPAGGSPLPPVVLLHGLGSCSDDWELQLPALAPERRVLAVDLWGHGRSGRAGQRFRIEDLAADVDGLAGQLGIQPAHWVGLSLGALVSLQSALDYPEHVLSLTLVNGFARVRLHPASAFGGAGRLALLLIGRMDWMGRWVARSLFPQPSQAELRALAARRIGANDRGSYLRTLLAVLAFDIRSRLGEIKQPSLVVAGAEDRIVPLAAKVSLARGLAEARLEIVPGSGHATPIDSAPVFNRLLVDFLRAGDRPPV
jgi:3-oxoadipate enol-lactonase